MFEGRSIWKRLKSRYALLSDATVFVALAAIVMYTVSKHEPWADEAETWVEVRDVPWLRLVFSQLRYDGHLPLWHALVWAPIHLFHMPYDYFVYIGGVCAVGGLAVLVFLAPFPRPLRYVIAASFFFLYQYAVVARPYVLMPLLGFLAAYFYRQGLPRVMAFAIATALLIQDSTYAAVIGFGLSAFYAWQIARRWKEVSAEDRKRVWRAGGVIAASLIFGVIVLFPKADSPLMAEATHASLSHHLHLVAEGLTGAFAQGMLPAIPLLVLAGAWAYQRRGLPLLLLTVGGTALEYGFVRGFGHHQGLITIAFVVFLWAAWPTAKQFAGLQRSAKLLHQALLVALLVTFGWHCTWSYKAVRGDWAGPYSGALDAAKYLKLMHADELGCSGYLFWAVGVQPYFDHNIFLNYGGPDAPAFYNFSKEFQKRADVITESQARNGPPFIVVATEYESPQEAVPMIESYRSVDYVLVHYSDGTRFFKGTPGVHASYFIFEKIDFVGGMRQR